MTHAKETVNAFFEIPLGISEDIVHDLADGLEHLFREYTTFVASCGKNNRLSNIPSAVFLDHKFVKGSVKRK